MTTKKFAKLRGIFIFLIGLILGYIYLSKFNVIDISTVEGKVALTAWAYLGGYISIMFLGWGICDLLISDNKEDNAHFYDD